MSNQMFNEQNIFDIVRKSIRPIDLIGRYTIIDGDDSNEHMYRGKCPFSKCSGVILINEQRKVFSCSSCSMGGDVSAFLSQKDNVTLLRAAQKLVKEYNIDIDDHLMIDEAMYSK